MTSNHFNLHPEIVTKLVLAVEASIQQALGATDEQSLPELIREASKKQDPLHDFSFDVCRNGMVDVIIKHSDWPKQETQSLTSKLESMGLAVESRIKETLNNHLQAIQKQQARSYFQRLRSQTMSDITLELATYLYESQQEDLVVSEDANQVLQHLQSFGLTQKRLKQILTSCTSLNNAQQRLIAIIGSKNHSESSISQLNLLDAKQGRVTELIERGLRKLAAKLPYLNEDPSAIENGIDCEMLQDLQTQIVDNCATEYFIENLNLSQPLIVLAPQNKHPNKTKPRELPSYDLTPHNHSAQISTTFIRLMRLLANKRKDVSIKTTTVDFCQATEISIRGNQIIVLNNLSNYNHTGQAFWLTFHKLHKQGVIPNIDACRLITLIDDDELRLGEFKGEDKLSDSKNNGKTSIIDYIGREHPCLRIGTRTLLDHADRAWAAIQPFSKTATGSIEKSYSLSLQKLMWMILEE